MSNSNNTSRDLALIQELHTAIGLAQFGLGSLQKIDGSNDFYHLPLLLLAGAKERLLKVILSIHSKSQTGSYPTIQEMKNFGHDLEKILQEVTEPSLFGAAWVSSPGAGKTDHDFLTQDQHYQEMVSILSYFGRYGRYANLDFIAGQPQAQDSPQTRWQLMEKKILSSINLPQPTSYEEQAHARQQINRQVMMTLERAFRALARWFTLGGGKPDAAIHSSLLMPFLNLRDEDLGENTWS